VCGPNFNQLWTDCSGWSLTHVEVFVRTSMAVATGPVGPEAAGPMFEHVH